MEVPRAIREQIREYEKEGFHVLACEHRAGAHFKVWFAEFNEPQFLTKNTGDWRSLKNNIAHYKRLAAQKEMR